MAMSFLVFLIMTIVAGVLLIWWYYQLNEQSEEKQKVTLCKDSVQLRASTAISLGSGTEEIKYTPILCQTIDKKVSGDKKEVQKAIADSMATCWQMFGEGRLKKNIFNTISSFGGDASCFMCYTIMVDPNSKFKVKDNDAGIRDIDFQQYLQDTAYRSYTPQNSKEGTPKLTETYINYIQSGSGPGYFYGFLTDQGIKPGRAYAVMYKAKYTDCGAGCVPAAVFGTLTAFTGALRGNFISTAAGTVAGGAGVGGLIRDVLTTQTQIDGIFLVDMSDPDLSKAFFEGENHCNYVADLAGG